MATVTYNRENLSTKTNDELRSICRDMGIAGMSKKPKAVIVDAIMLAASPDEVTGLAGITAQMTSVVTNPDAAPGQRITSTIRVTSGASAGQFPVVGKSVAEVSEFLREVLNVDKMSTGLVNGREVPGDYVLREGDSLEFLKPAGKKGC
jgi:hypothetical protein